MIVPRAYIMKVRVDIYFQGGKVLSDAGETPSGARGLAEAARIHQREQRERADM